MTSRQEKEINALIQRAFEEDLGNGDHSSRSCIPASSMGKAQLLIKEDGVLAGIDVAVMVAKQYSDRLNIEVKIPDGTKVKVGDIAFIIEGPSIEILSVERLILNLMQRMSAIATLTKKYVDLLEGTHTRVLDTRKTTPGLRALEKWAVRIGGGVNHRMGLYDMIMLKDNHIDFAGGIDQAIEKTHVYLEQNKLDIPIEIETRHLDEVSQVIRKGGVQRIMLDNFDYEDTRRAVEMIAGKYETESSGGINLETARKYAECGVDYISVGALTHSVHNMDMSLKALE